MLSSDYPHHDYDEPKRTLPPGISAETRRRVWRENAIELYDLPRTRSTERWEPIGLDDGGTVGDTKAAAIAGNTARPGGDVRMIVDMSVHPVLDDDELRRRIGPPWSKGRVPHLLGTRYQPPFDEIVAPLDQAGDPGGRGPRTLRPPGRRPRGGHPADPRPAAQSAAGRGDRLRRQRLGGGALAGRRPSLRRVAARGHHRHPAGARRRSTAGPTTNGSCSSSCRCAPSTRTATQQYFPLFEAAVAHDLPVAIFDDDATVVEHHETPVGALRYFSEKHALRPARRDRAPRPA